LNEDILAQFLSFGKVAKPAEGDRHDMPLETLEQVAKGLAVATLCGPNQADQVGVIGIQSEGSHGMLQKSASMNKQARDEAKNGPVRAIAGSVKQRTTAASGKFTVNHRESRSAGIRCLGC